MPAIYLHSHQVEEAEIDEQGHASNVAYVEWMQSAAIAHSAAQGWPPDRYRELKAGWVARSHRIEYWQPAFAGDELIVQTWVADFQKVTSLRKYKIVRPADATVLAIAETNWVFVGLAKRVPRRVPSELSQSFEIVPPESEP